MAFVGLNLMYGFEVSYI